MTNFIHISSAEKRDGIPEMDEGKACARVDCPGPQNWEFGYGLAGGGMGCYHFCNACNEIKEKTCDPDE